MSSAVKDVVEVEDGVKIVWTIGMNRRKGGNAKNFKLCEKNKRKINV